MKKRKQLSRKKSRRNFRAGNKIKAKNFMPGAMRGGIRL